MCATSETRVLRGVLSAVGLLFVLLWLPCGTSADKQSCPNGYITFEVITGYVYTAPSDTIELKPGTLQLTECLNHCKRNKTCQSVNFETGLCVLFTSSATERPTGLSVSQFPVFTIYAQKICLLGKKPCKRDWKFERVTGYELRDLARKTIHASSREQCMDLCLDEEEFECRSANYEPSSGDCVLSDMDRHSVIGDRYFIPSSETNEYLENNCVDDPVRLCEFRAVNGKILKTVDAVFQNVSTVEECRQLCLSVPYRCHSFDMGDPANSVCRLSHLARASLTHIESPYLEIPGATTNELAACYNVTIHCKAREMVAKVKTSKVFNGKVYSKSRPNSCVTDVINSLDFQIRMAYHELECDVKQESLGQFSTDIVIQHHDMIVTNQDLGLAVHCQYDLTNRSVSNGVQLEVDGREVEASQSQLATVSSPNVTMRITDRNGEDVFTAQVGDPLALRFEIIDHNSPYEMFIRELVAMDGVDSSEILLIDEAGCPTDRTIMGPLHKVNEDGKVLHAPFDAFKFPTSEIVQFKALVTPCLPNCEPARCPDKSQSAYGRDVDSYGRRKRRWTRDGQESRRGGGRTSDRGDQQEPTEDEEDEEELVVVQTIKITDKFGFSSARRAEDSNDVDGSTKHDTMMMDTDSSGCMNIIGLIVACSLFLMAQVVLLLVWGCVWQRRRRNKLQECSMPSVDILYAPTRQPTRAQYERPVFENPNDITPYDVVYNARHHGSRLR